MLSVNNHGMLRSSQVLFCQKGALPSEYFWLGDVQEAIEIEDIDMDSGAEAALTQLQTTSWKGCKRQEELEWDRFLTQISYLDHHST